jgi:hypothetical protein
MSGVRSMLARVKRIEAVRAPLLSPFEIGYGSLDAWEAGCRVGIEEGYLDGPDVTVVMLAVRRWHRDGAWAR